MGSHYGLGEEYEIPPEAFADPNNPLESEVQKWIDNNIPKYDQPNSFIIYNNNGNKYVWKIFFNTNGLLELYKTVNYLIVNNNKLSYEPSISGNVINTNSVVISNKGQHWIIGKDGNAVNLNVSEGSYEVTDPEEGFIYKDINGDRWKIRVTTDGSINTEKL